MNAWDQVNFTDFLEYMQKAYGEDPDFFMPYYMESLYHYYFQHPEEFENISAKAINVNAKLSDGEQLMRDALKELIENPKADLTPYGEQLVKLYPEDGNAYFTLISYQMFQDDYYENAESTLLQALEVVENPAPIYNLLVYSYIETEQFDKAKEAADKQLSLVPEWANAYDTKGDYFMAVKMYGSAFDQFMRAYKMDSDFTYSKKKAMKAKKLLNEQCITAQIKKLMNAYEEAILASDAEEVISYYLDDPDFVFYGYGQFNGYKDWIELVKKDFESTSFEGDFYKDIKVHVLSDKVAFVYSSVEYSMVKASDEERTMEGGTVYVLVKKGDDWKIVHGIGSQNKK